MDEIRDILKELAIDLVALKESQKETERRFRETDEMLTKRFLEAEKFQKEVRELQKENALQQKQTDLQLKQTDHQLKKLGKKLGELGNSLGSFAEGMAFPSLEQILMQKFGASNVAARSISKRGGDTLEVDVLGYSNGQTNTAVIVEVKSHLKDEHLDQILNTLEKFPRFFPEHKDKDLYGILVGVRVPESIKNLARKKGIYIGRMGEDSFKLQIPKNFRPKNFKAA